MYHSISILLLFIFVRFQQILCFEVMGNNLYSLDIYEAEIEEKTMREFAFLALQEFLIYY